MLRHARFWQIVVLAFVVLLPFSRASAQVAPTADKLRIFLDCHAFGCDFDYFRTEIPFVDYVRDRKDAALHVLVSTQSTGGGGIEYTLTFIGLRELAGATDTLRYASPTSATDDERRKGIAKVLKLGLVRYVAHTSQASGLQISYASPDKKDSSKKSTRDPWNYWVFRTRAGGNFSGESSQHFTYLNGSVSANRTTKDWKISTSVNGNYSESSFTLGEGEVFKSYSRSYGANELIVKSVTDHWSVGQRASLSSSTFSNSKLAARFAPAVEYNFFPYSQSTRRLVTLQYSAGVNSYQYRDTTIYEKMHEVRTDQSLLASIGLTQPWGSVNGSIEGANYLDDFSKRRLVFFNNVNARLFKGFSLSLFSSIGLVHDQLYLPKGAATDEEILLQRRQLETSYRYYAGVSLTYSFGSIFNNVVNPRFDGASGTFYF